MFHKKIINYLSTSRRFEGGLILNILGYHIFRIIFFKLAFLLRRKRKISDSKNQEYYEKLESDGIVVIPNFFTQAEYQEIREECAKLEMEIYHEGVPRMLCGTRIRGSDLPSELFKKLFGNNETINQLVSASVRKDILVSPGIEFQKVYVAPEDFGKDSTETADNLHFDMSFPTIKCFYYLDRVSKENGAFSYVRFSHKMTIPRILLEYKMSIAFWFLSKKDRQTVTPEVDPEYLRKNLLTVESIVGNSNTLVIANTMGFHRRGDFSGQNPREIIIVNYRPLDTLSYLKNKLYLK